MTLSSSEADRPLTEDLSIMWGMEIVSRGTGNRIGGNCFGLSSASRYELSVLAVTLEGV